MSTMLKWNIKDLLATKGVAQPYSWLKKQGLAHDLSHRLLAGKQQRVDIVTVNKICTAAWSTPNDLFVWQPDDNTIVDAAHPLHKLKAKAISQLNEKLKKLTPDQIAALDKLADELGEG